jgi:trimeric autotransporter adhesin
MQRSFGRIAAISLFVLSIAVPSFFAQGQAATPDRIVQSVDDGVRTTLAGNIHPLANAKDDLGAAPASQPMNHVQLVLQRSPAQEAALDAFLAAAQVQGSPSYHKWLTPQQFGQLYGPSEADIQKVTGWLAGEGFTVNNVSSGRTTVDFSGSAEQVQNAFHTAIHMYQANGVNFLANAGNPTIPTALAPVISGITHLNNIPLKPLYKQAGLAKFDSQKHRFVPATTVHSQYTTNFGEGYLLFAVPGDAATIYDTPNSTLNANFTGTTSYTGTGVTIGIMGQTSIDPTLVQAFRTLFVGDTKAPIISNLDGVGSTDDFVEAYLDNEVSGGLAPGATIHFYTASATTDNGVITSAQAAIEDNTIDILSMSYGLCELFNSTSGNQQVYGLWQQAAAQGITVVVSSGDSGSAGCDDPDSESVAGGPLAINGLASTPYNIAVGGTDYDALYPASGANNFSKYVSTGSPGSATTFYRTALSYIPEATWNDSTLNNTTISQNVSLNENNLASNISAGSGGPSSCTINSTTGTTVGTCTSGYAKPSWQTGTGVPNDQARDIPDVSLLAGTGFYGATWTTCDGNTSGFDSSGNSGSANCVVDPTTGDFFTDGVGGTSAAAPAFAGIMALVVQKTGQRQGQAAPTLYALFNSTPSVFHDVTTGNNSVPCTASTATAATCLLNSQSWYYESGYNTFTGYDLATGLGSVDATLLVNNWTSAGSNLFVANVAATPSATTITTADPLTFTVNVTPLATGGATPTGTVSVTDGVYTLPTAVVLVNGSATITIPANSLTANAADVFTVSYAPPATGAVFASASTFVTVAITQAATPAIALTGASITVVEGAAGTSTISVTPSGGFTGAVALTCAVTPTTGTSAPTCSVTPPSVTIAGTAASTTTLNVATTATTTAGTYTVTVNGADTATGKVTATAPIALTVNSAATPSLGVNVTPVAIALPATTGTGGAITVTPGGGFTGAVNLTCAITTPAGATCTVAPTSVTIAGTTAQAATLTVTILSTTAAGSYTANVSAADAATGKITATDAVTVTVTGTGAAESISFTPAPTTATVASPGQSATSTISVTSNYVGGKINFGFVLATAPANAATTYNPACTAPALTTVNGVATVAATCTTTAATTAAVSYPKTREKTNRWYEAAGGAALACVLFFGIPARRRGWRSMLGLLVFLVTMAGVGCGGGGNNSGGGGTAGTTTGTYTYTVTGTDSVTSATTATGTVTVVVN